MILNIETSSNICSVALCENGEVLFEKISDKVMEHSTLLAPFVEEAMTYINRRDLKLNCVAVSIGPGSYTGLRIGLSLAKGLCYGLAIPLIGIPTLEILAVKAMFNNSDWSGEELIVPMMDARRMEVYTAVYNSRLQELLSPTPLILESSSFNTYQSHKLIFIGECIEKAMQVVDNKNAVWIKGSPLARDMNVLSEKAMLEQKYLDLAYSVPMYLKNFQATTPKSKFL